MFWLLKLLYDTYSFIYKRLSYASMNLIIFPWNGSVGIWALCVFFCSLPVCVYFYQYELPVPWLREGTRSKKKRQEVSLGSRIAGNICYHRRGESGGGLGRTRFTRSSLIRLEGGKWRHTQRNLTHLPVAWDAFLSSLFILFSSLVPFILFCIRIPLFSFFR